MYRNGDDDVERVGGALAEADRGSSGHVARWTSNTQGHAVLCRPSEDVAEEYVSVGGEALSEPERQVRHTDAADRSTDR